MAGQQISSIADQIAKENPDIADEMSMLKQMEGVDTDMFRGYAINVNRDYIKNGYATNTTIFVIHDPTLASIPLAFLTAQFEDSIENNGGKVLTQGVNEVSNPNGIEIEYVDIEQKITFMGNQYTVDSRVLMFISGDNLIMVQISTPKDFLKDIFPISEEIGPTIKFLK